MISGRQRHFGLWIQSLLQWICTIALQWWNPGMNSEYSNIVWCSHCNCIVSNNISPFRQSIHDVHFCEEPVITVFSNSRHSIFHSTYLSVRPQSVSRTPQLQWVRLDHHTNLYSLSHHYLDIRWSENWILGALSRTCGSWMNRIDGVIIRHSINIYGFWGIFEWICDRVNDGFFSPSISHRIRIKKRE